jgi:hypothetical protein
MCWASRRQTTREEDIAYCLLGIFDVNMPLLYGEGKKAFFRLQLEIMKASTDYSLFAWGMDNTGVTSSTVSIYLRNAHEWQSMLAVEPSRFANSGSIVGYLNNGSPYTHTSQGIEMELAFLGPLIAEDNDNTGISYALLSCHLEDDPRCDVGVPLGKVANNVYCRTSDAVWMSSVARVLGSQTANGSAPFRLHH